MLGGAAASQPLFVVKLNVVDIKKKFSIRDNLL